MHQRTRNQCAVAIMTATKWRIDHDMIGAKGFVMTYGKTAFGFAEQLPEIENRNPICVDEQMDCFSAFNKTFWACLTTPEKIPPVERDKEHISTVAQEMLIYCFPGWSEQIKSWFEKCRIPREHSRWIRMERATLGEIFSRIVDGVSADHFLMAAYG